MVAKIINSYYNFFDEKIEHGALVVLIISLLILFVGFFGHDNNFAKYSSISVLNSKDLKNDNIFIISGEKYKITLEKID